VGDKRQVMWVPLNDMEMLGILHSILIASWRAKKTFSITVICGATGRRMTFPTEGTMLASCDRAGEIGVATKKANVLRLF